MGTARVGGLEQGQEFLLAAVCSTGASALLCYLLGPKVGETAADPRNAPRAPEFCTQTARNRVLEEGHGTVICNGAGGDLK